MSARISESQNRFRLFASKSLSSTLDKTICQPQPSLIRFKPEIVMNLVMTLNARLQPRHVYRLPHLSALKSRQNLGNDLSIRASSSTVTMTFTWLSFLPIQALQLTEAEGLVRPRRTKKTTLRVKTASNQAPTGSLKASVMVPTLTKHS